jgi:hypothetical protein
VTPSNTVRLALAVVGMVLLQGCASPPAEGGASRSPQGSGVCLPEFAECTPGNDKCCPGTWCAASGSICRKQ